MGQSPDSSTYNDKGEGLPFYQGKTEFGELYPTPVKYCNKPNKIGDIGDVLLSVRAPVGPTNLLNHTACIGRGLSAIKPSGGISSKFVLFILRSVQNELSNAGTGTTFKAITKDFLYTLKFPIPPLAEQHRIVAKIEELFSELDKGVETFRAAQQQLKVYRQAVLQWAFEGKLTEEWREENTKQRSAAELIEMIRKTRMNQGLVKKMAPLMPLTKDRYNEMHILPEKWCWVKIGEVFGVYVGSTPSRNIAEYWGGTIPWVSSSEVRFRDIYDTREKISEQGLKNSSVVLHPPGTVLMAMIGEGKTRGQVAVLKIEATHNQNAAAIRVSETECSPRYLYYYLWLNYQKTREIGSGNNQKALNKQRVSNLFFPFAPYEEQQQIVAEIESRLSVCDKLEETITQSLLQAEALRQSILKKAFAGKLVPQDPSDEPAEKLLARIRAERAANPDKIKSAKRKVK